MLLPTLFFCASQGSCTELVGDAEAVVTSCREPALSTRGGGRSLDVTVRSVRSVSEPVREREEELGVWSLGARLGGGSEMDTQTGSPCFSLSRGTRARDREHPGGVRRQPHILVVVHCHAPCTMCMYSCITCVWRMFGGLPVTDPEDECGHDG